MTPSIYPDRWMMIYRSLSSMQKKSTKNSLFSHLNTLSDPTRVRLLLLLEHEELGVGELVNIVQLPQSTVSRHLKTLLTDGWLTRRAEGNTSLLRMDVGSLPAEAHQLWAVVRKELAPTHRDDLARMQSVLALRRGNSEAFFGRLAGRWDSLRKDLFGDQYLLPTLLTLLPPNMVIADLGCGTGEVLAGIAPAAGSVIGIDREAVMLDAARQRTQHLSNVSIRAGGLERLPLENNEVDAVLCMLVLHHVKNPHVVFQEIARVLRPNGTMVLLDMIEHDRTDFRHSMGHQHLGFSPDKLLSLTLDSGLMVVQRRTLPMVSGALGPGLFLATLTHNPTEPDSSLH